METKICSKCGEEKTLDMFSKQKTTKDGLRSWCKECFKEYNKKYSEKNKDKIKECKKKYSEGNKDKINKYHKKYREENKNKINEYHKQYLEEHAEKRQEIQKKYGNKNRDKINEYYKNYSEENKDKINERQKKWREENIDDLLEHEKKYREKNVDKIKESSKKWKSENKDKTNIYTQRRRARKLVLPSTFTLKEWGKCKTHFDNKCCYCGEELPLTMEHFIAVDNGGGYVKSNIICACGSCNYSKNNKEFHSWYKSYKFYSKEREDKILEYLEINKEE